MDGVGGEVRGARAARSGRGWAASALGLGLIVGLGLSPACEPAPGRPAGPTAAPRDPGGAETAAPLEVLYAGCQAIDDERTCTLRQDDVLRLWVPAHPDRPLAVALDGGDASAASVVAADVGQRVELRPPASATRLTLTTPGHPPWVLGLAFEGADEAAPPGSGRALAEAARARGDLAYRRGAYDEALAEYDAAMTGLALAGRQRAASDVALTASFACSELLLDLEGAATWLERHAALIDRFPEARLRHTYYRGLLSERRGDLRQALADYAEHAAIAGRLGLATDAFAARSAEAVLRGRLGDLAGSAAALAAARALADAVDPRERGRLLNNTAWTWILARERGQASDDPRGLLREALAISDEDGLRPEPAIAAHVRVNLALAELQAGDLGAAERLLGRLEAAPSGRRQALWSGYARARAAALAGADEEAAGRFAAVRVDALAAGVGELEVLALVGRGRALIAQNRPGEALEALFEAERALDRRLSEIAASGGRERFAAVHDRGAREALSLLVALGRPREALCVGRLARSRTFEALARIARHRADERGARSLRARSLARYRARRADLEATLEASWTLPRRDGELARAALRDAAARDLAELDASLAPLEIAPIARATCEELARPAEGELLLALLPGADGWFGFADDGRALQVARLRLPDAADPSPDAWSEALLGPFAAAIAGAARIRVITSGPLLAAPIHALPFAGAPLHARAAVAYALDLPRASSAAAAPIAAVDGRALVIAPPSNLASAAAEVDAVVGALASHGPPIELLVGDAASGAAVRERLPGAALLHFVGHAHDDAALAWDAALELAGGGSLTIADLLALPGPAPGLVVLNGCETGLADPDAAAGGMSLAHGLLVAGAEAVIATSAVIDDAAALTLTEALYDALYDGAVDGPPALRGPAALAAAMTALPGDALAETRASYRAWVR